jgi:hypothetical protein
MKTDRSNLLALNSFIYDRSQALIRYIADDVEDAEVPTMRKLVTDEIDRPECIRHDHAQQGCASATDFLAALPLAHGQAFLAIVPLRLLVVHRMAFSPQQDLQPPIAAATPFSRQRPRRSVSSGRQLRYGIEVRSAPATEYARRSLIS